MKKIVFCIITLLITTSLTSQVITEGGVVQRNIRLDNSNSWAIGGGVSNFIMHGDLRSIGTGNLGNFWNFGAYVLIDKMFNPLLGIEAKVNYSKISGGAQYFSSVYDILYVPSTTISNNLFFKGTSYGVELNLILSLTNLYIAEARKWNIAAYFGAGYHQYDSALFEKLADGSNNLLIDFGRNPSRNSVYEASSIYLTAQIGLKYRINQRVDLELRPSMYFNNEDHLDATISNKQDWESFFVTHLGIVIKLGKRKVFTIWGGDKVTGKKFEVVDTDGDGVIDELDIEPNTPKGVLVYGNGKAIDSDKDGLPDYKDDCPLVPGPVTNNGCPIILDTDGDGILDDKDLCPTEKGPATNKGCPIKEKTEEILTTISKLSESVYFDTAKATIQKTSLSTLDKIVKLMNVVEDVDFVIEGHTDNVGNNQNNLSLSKRRANAVRLYLITHGVNPSKLKSEGFGETRPKYSNETKEGRQLNRRVEIKSIGYYKTVKHKK